MFLSLDVTFHVDFQFLIWTGAVSLAMVILGVTARYILKWVLEDRKVSSGEYLMLTLLEYFNYAISTVQAGMIVVGAVYIGPHLPGLTTDRRDKYVGNSTEDCDPTVKYCDYDLVMFSLTYFGFCWTFIAMGLVCLLYIRCFSMDEERAFRLALQRATEEGESVGDTSEKWEEGERLAKWAGEATEAASEGIPVSTTGRPSDTRYRVK